MQLAKSQIKNPDANVIDLICRRFSSELLVACGDEDRSSTLYRMVQALPGKTTVAQIGTSLEVTVNGPLNTEYGTHLLTATKADGAQCMVKILRFNGDNFGTSAEVQKELLSHEASMVEILGLGNPSVRFVPTVNASITIPEIPEAMLTAGSCSGSFNCLIMPRFVTNVAEAPKFNFATLINQGKQLESALEFMHSKNVVHLDVKGANVFVDQPGNWYLGDFGSCRKVGEVVVSTTKAFYPTSIIGKPACCGFDWYMLCVMLCIAALPANESVQIFGARVSDASIRAFIRDLQDDDLKVFLENIMKKHDRLRLSPPAFGADEGPGA